MMSIFIEIKLKVFGFLLKIDVIFVIKFGNEIINMMSV